MVSIWGQCQFRLGTFLTASALGIAIPGTLRADPPALNTIAGVNPADFRYTTFASGLNYPVGMQMLSDGSLLVATNNPVNDGGFYNSTGSLLRFVDANGDGVADNPAGTVVYSGLTGTISSLTQAGNLLFITSSAPNAEGITVLQMSSPTSYSLLGTEQFSFPAKPNGDGWEHTSYTAISRPVAGLSNNYNIYFNIGSQYDNITTPASTTVTAAGLFNANLHGDSIYRFTVNENGTPTFSTATQIASGLRNAAGMAFQPGTGDFYFDDNGIDNGVNDPTYNENGKEYSADEMNMIPAAQVGTTVPDFGFAHSVVLESDGSEVGDGLGVQPLQTFRALADGAQSEGPNQIAFAPSDFPAGLNDGIFVTFDGNGFPGTANDQNPLVYYDPATNQYFHFIEGGQADMGHLDGIISTDNAVFLSELDSTEAVYGPGEGGAGDIYELIAVPEPGTLFLAAICLLIFARQRSDVTTIAARYSSRNSETSTSRLLI